MQTFAFDHSPDLTSISSLNNTIHLSTDMSKSNATGRYGDETLSHSTMIHQIKQINEAQKTVDELSKELAELSAKDRKLATMSYAEAEAEIHRMAAEHRRLIRECEVMKESS